MLTPHARELAAGANYAVVATTLPSGQPQAHVMWVGTDGIHVLLNTLQGRQKLRNIEADPRVTITIINGTDWFDWVEIRGHVVETVSGEPATDHIDELSKQYFGQTFAGPRSPRVILKVLPDRVIEHHP